MPAAGLAVLGMCGWVETDGRQRTGNWRELCTLMAKQQPKIGHKALRARVLRAS